MKDELRSAANDISALVLPTEAKIDEALASAASLMTTMLTARANTGVGAGLGHIAVAQVAQAQAAMVEARQAMIRAHRELAKVGGQVGFETIAGGDLYEDCPDTRGQAERRLTVVG
jgi:hypothetical protein